MHGVHANNSWNPWSSRESKVRNNWSYFCLLILIILVPVVGNFYGEHVLVVVVAQSIRKTFQDISQSYKK